MSEELNTTGGADAGAPETVAAEQPVAGGEVDSAPNPDAEHLEWLKTADWNKIPAEIRRPHEEPILREFNRKLTDRSTVDQQHLRALEAITDKLTAQGAAPNTQQREELMDRIRSGDPEAVQELINSAVAPLQQQVTLKSQIEDAQNRVPELRNKQFEAQVGAAIQADPMARELASAGNHRYASAVITAVANNLLIAQRNNEIAQLKASIEERVKQGISEHRAKVAALPASTTKTGSTSGSGGTKEYNSVLEAVMDAWPKAGGAFPQ